MIKFTVWNVDRARPARHKPLSKREAMRLADELENKYHRPYIVLPI